ncbi:solute carrier family 43 member 3-like [Mizuhopecten yessoensis]|uniref:solute carrier family 43 member 3-like n=1 Tax=Mizuhopecten yessoensis TaxID=6573 RepID=UPI000B45DEA9|nr:solute carrier family 43 member 3-like [Mizuhopecten yessoensis]XP_021354762.1 solute carrier family 43 member 3-like [Mizuhopecten yessoensis]XP_021354763.1 solute carrier family 43 member 3-like [Mizuhopecten yessoensis]
MKYHGWRKYLVAVWAFIETFLFAGLLYGWASVNWILKQENVYADLCPQTTFKTNVTINGTDNVVTYDTVGGNTTSQNGTDVGPNPIGYRPQCRPQDEKFALCFTIGSALFCASSALFGHINYKFGTRITRICSMIIFMSGTIMFAFVDTERPWLIYPGLAFIGMGGLPLLVTNAQIGNLFPKGSSTWIGLLCGGFDCSSAVQFMVKGAYETGIRIQYSYGLLTGLHLMVGVSTFFFLPKKFIPRPSEAAATEVAQDEKTIDLLENDKLNGSTTQENGQVYEKTTFEVSDEKASDTPSLKSCLMSATFLLHVFWLCLLQLRFYFFLSSVNTYLHRITNNDKYKVSYFTNVMMYTMLGGLFSSMFSGIVYDWQRRMFQDSRMALRRKLMPAILPLMITCGLGVLLSVLVLIPQEEVLYFVFIVMTLYRSFIYSIGAAYLSAMFPNEYFGLLYGVWIIAAGIVGFLQIVFFNWAQSYLEGPFHADLFCLCFVTLSFIHPIFQWLKCRREAYNMS